MMLYDILEDANGTSEIVPGHEDGNCKQVNVISIKDASSKGPSGHSRNMHMYEILTNEPFKETYVEDGEEKTRDSSKFFPGQKCVLCYEKKESTSAEQLQEIRKDQLFTVVNVSEKGSCFLLKVMSKDALQIADEQHIEFNHKKIDSQKDNLNFPGDIILTNVDLDAKKVTIKFKNKANKATMFYVAYRKADCDDNTEWTYAKTNKEELTLENIEKADYYIRVMYYDSSEDEFSFFSPEVLMNFY